MWANQLNNDQDLEAENGCQKSGLGVVHGHFLDVHGVGKERDQAVQLGSADDVVAGEQAMAV